MAASTRDSLFPAQSRAMFRDVMRHRSIRKLLAMFLAVFVTASMGLSVAQAGGMAVRIAMASDMAGSGHDGCPSCPNGGDYDGMKVMACGGVCAAPVLAVLPQGASLPTAQKSDSYPAHDTFLHGRRAPPDPYPPRTTDIG